MKDGVTNHTSSKMTHSVFLGELSESCEMIGDLLLECSHIATALQNIADTVLLEPFYKFNLLLIPAERFSR